MVAPMTTYLVGLDGSDHARDALDWAARGGDPGGEGGRAARQRPADRDRPGDRRHGRSSRVRGGVARLRRRDARRSRRPPARRAHDDRPSRRSRWSRRPSSSAPMSSSSSATAARGRCRCSSARPPTTSSTTRITRSWWSGASCAVPVQRVSSASTSPAGTTSWTPTRWPPCAGRCGCPASSRSRWRTPTSCPGSRPVRCASPGWSPTRRRLTTTPRSAGRSRPRPTAPAPPRVAPPSCPSSPAARGRSR